VTASRADRRQRILEAALHCFSASGIEAASIADICERSGASVGSVYHRFGNKEGIVLVLLAEGLRANLEELRTRLPRCRTARDSVHQVVDALIDWITEHPDLARFIYAHLGQYGHLDCPQLRAVNDDHAQLLATILDPHRASGALRELPPAVWRSLALGPVHDYARRWLNAQVDQSPTLHRELFRECAWNALRAPAGADHDGRD
jgi:AcrR family transcriptional regulator